MEKEDKLRLDNYDDDDDENDDDENDDDENDYDEMIMVMTMIIQTPCHYTPTKMPHYQLVLIRIVATGGVWGCDVTNSSKQPENSCKYS